MRGPWFVLSLLLASALSAVTLDPLVPGKDYRALTVSGEADAAVQVKLVDRVSGSESVTKSAAVTAGRFTVDFENLAPGHEYAVLVDEVEVGIVVMAREMTDGWVHENISTFSGTVPGTGEWGGTGVSEAAGGRIAIAAVLDGDEQENVAFTPTNRFGDAVGYWVRADVSFEGEAEGVRDTDGLFGVTLVKDPQDDSRAVFYIIDGQTWKRTDAVGEIATPYEWEFFVNEESRKVDYYLLGGASRRYLGAGAIPSGVPTRFRSVDFQGYGSVGSLEGEAFDTKLFAAEVHFDGLDEANDSISAGKNFTNLFLKGWVSVTNLWDTDVASGTIEVTITGSDGVSRTLTTADWSGFDGVYGITNFIDGLTRGEKYTISVSVKETESGGSSIVDNGDWVSHGVMGRARYWYAEDAATVGGIETATGDWEVSDGLTVTAADGGMVVVSSDGTVEGANAVFTPTNRVPRNGETCVNTFDVFFDSAMDFDALPNVSGELFGITFADGGEGESLAVVINGGWQLVDRATFAPIQGRCYKIDVITGNTENGPIIEYYVSEASGSPRLVKRGGFRPGSKQYPADITFSGDGRFLSAVGEFFDTTLFMVDFDPLNLPGTNFTAVSVSGSITVTPAWDTDCSNGTFRVIIRNGRGEIVMTKDVEFHGNSSINVNVDGLEPGESYTATIEVVESDGPADGDVEYKDILVPTAKKYDGKWIDEDALTFSKAVVGTGDWRFRRSPNTEAHATEDPVYGPVIQIESELNSSVTFEATNDAPAVANSTVREVTFEISTEVAGFNMSVPEYAKARPADIAGVTTACDDLHGEKLHFAVYNPEGGGSWRVLTDTVAELGKVYTFTVIITYPNPNRTVPSSIAYYLEKAGGSRQLLAFVEPATGIPEITDNYRTRLRFVGSGFVRSILGECYDAHLADVGGIEYWTIADAVREIGDSGRVLTPLWYSTYIADTAGGWFGVRDPNNWLNVIWPLGYVVEITDSGEVRFYLFRLSDYWIDWAVGEDAVETPTGWEVKSANGLAWLAKQSTNDWITGEITLADDITNLYEHIWTPINGFTGTFDGNGRTIVGPTNKGADICSTNSLDMTAYGLFATASNSVFRNVNFDRVAISNSADAVASLLGCSIGDLTLTNVVVRSGEITGGGQFVSGIVGYVGDFNAVSIRQNVNAATLAIPDAPLGGVNVSGIANLGGSGFAAGSLSVVSNENRGAIETTINSTIGGGNVAQILAGSDPETIFNPEAIDVTGNIGTGDVARVTSLNHPGWPLGTLPVVNLSAEVSRQSTDHDYKQFIEANDSTDVLIDPWRLKARMTGSFYQDGATNYAGIINDQITASMPGSTVTVQDSCEIWSSIVLDRAITLDLNAKVIDNVFETYTFEVASDAGGAVVKNGTVTYPVVDSVEMLATRPDGDQWRMEGVVTAPWSCSYWDRTLFVNGEFLSAVSLPTLMQVMRDGSVIAVPEDSAYSIDAKAGELLVNGRAFVSFSALGYSVREEQDGGDTVYIVELTDDPVETPEINLAIVPNGGTAKVVVNGAKTGFEYCLQSVETLAESWDKATDEWVTVTKDSEALEFEVDTSRPSGFYRIKIRKQ